jgi:peptidoglycan L-alanyl-D-glutamate endopeptidase CwlK
MTLAGLHPVVRARAQLALDFARQQGVTVEVTSARRSISQQAKLYAEYKAGRSQFPANPPGLSGHNYGLAWDSVVDEPYRGWWTQVRQYFGFRVPPNDWIHAEVPNWQRYVGISA